MFLVVVQNRAYTTKYNIHTTNIRGPAINHMFMSLCCRIRAAPVNVSSPAVRARLAISRDFHPKTTGPIIRTNQKTNHYTTQTHLLKTQPHRHTSTHMNPSCENAHIPTHLSHELFVTRPQGYVEFTIGAHMCYPIPLTALAWPSYAF